jgi:hypothetical protein
MRAQAWINLGNDLRLSDRYVEAYDVYQRALEQSPNHPVAAGYSASVLFQWTRRTRVNSENALALAHYWALVAQADIALADHIAPGTGAFFAKFPTHLAGEGTPLQGASLTGYDLFVAQQRFHLSWSLDGVTNPEHWDHLVPPPIHTPFGESSDPPPIFAMLNSLRADFLLARRLAWDTLESGAVGPGLYTDTLDYATYGEKSAGLLLVARAALDILDRVAVAANSFFELGDDSDKVSFRNLWRDHQRPHAMRTRVAEIVGESNTAFYALIEMADDLQGEGWLEGRQRFRNVATHRFAVAHHELFRLPASTKDIKHMAVDDLESEMLTALRVARSGVLYLHGAVGHRTPGEPEGLPMHLSLLDT